MEGPVAGTADEQSAKMDDSFSVTKKFFENDHLLWLFLQKLSQCELLRSQSVCRRWKTTIESSYLLLSRIFGPQSFEKSSLSADLDIQINSLVSERIRWTPAMETTQANSLAFRAVTESPNSYLRSVANAGASWRSQLICWPPVFDVYVSNSIAEEEQAPFLRLTCPVRRTSASRLSSELDSGSETAEDGPEEEEEGMTVNIQDFPHNESKVLHGITYEDVLYGMRQHYLEYEDALEAFYENVDLNGDEAGKWVMEMEPREDNGSYKLDISILLF